VSLKGRLFLISMVDVLVGRDEVGHGCTAKTKYRNFETNIPRKGISRSQLSVPISTFMRLLSDLCIYSYDHSANFHGVNM
jgi:hypothetical protein